VAAWRWAVRSWRCAGRLAGPVAGGWWPVAGGRWPVRARTLQGQGSGGSEDGFGIVGPVDTGDVYVQLDLVSIGVKDVQAV
ncbi:MAG: hypothetical protein QOJ52_3812, partial [Acidimicrobiaceae bacterium]|nr:hypothetical protein [Acidimicrobiaceae bacterium]